MKIFDDTYLQHKENVYLKKCNILKLYIFAYTEQDYFTLNNFLIQFYKYKIFYIGCVKYIRAKTNLYLFVANVYCFKG